MNRTLKTLALFLLVSTVSFVYAQEEDGTDKAGKSMLSDDLKKADINAGLTAKKPAEKPSAKRLDSHETGKVVREGEGKKYQKRSFMDRLLGRNKVKKEEDPN